MLPLTMDLEHVFGPSLAVQVINVLGDDNHRAPLPPQPGLTLCNSQMGHARLFAHRQLPPVVVELPDPRWVPREGLWSGQVLWTDGERHRQAGLGFGVKAQR